jgi:stearoyl-CoA desaturase (delta-9 desaturase)
MVLLALPAGTPVQWVGTHRQHHLFTDVDGDPHSPLLFEFWYAHCGWYIPTKNKFICALYSLLGPLRMLFDGYWRPRHRLEYNHLAKDISANNFYNKISNPNNYMLALWLYCGIICSIFYSLAGMNGIIALWVILIVIYNLGDALNSIAHIYGQQGLQQNKHAKNNAVLSRFTFGEGFHANHHSNPHLIFPNDQQQISLSRFILFIWKSLGLIQTNVSNNFKN